jgi:glycosyltransferase involved in cell wall biosynthesis
MARILHVVGDSRYGGGSVLIERIATHAQQCGHDVSVLCTDKLFQEHLESCGVGFVPLDCLWRPIRPFRDAWGLIKLLRYLRRSGWDIVHTHTSKAGFMGRVAARLAGVPVVVHTVHGFAFHEQSPRFALTVYSLLERFAAHLCDAIVTVSNFHCAWAAALHIGNERIRVAVPNGIDPNRVKPTRSASATRQAIGIAPDAVMCLTIGRLAAQKGLDILLRAVPLTKDMDRLRVVIVGDGEHKVQLEALAKDLDITRQVRFLGFRNDVGDLLAAADIVVLPSLREGLSISLLEAMAAHKAIVATRIGSNEEATCNGKVALMVTAGSAGELAAALDTMVQDEGLRDHLGRLAFEEFNRNYHEDIMLGRYMALYTRLLNERLKPFAPSRGAGSLGVPK